MKKEWANKPFDPAKWPFFYGWMVLFWGTIGILMSMPGQTIGVSVFTEPLMDSLSISRNQLSLAYMLGTIGSSFLLPWAGRKYDRYGVRPVVVIASIGLGMVLLILSQIDTILIKMLNLSSGWVIVGVMIILFLFLRFFGQGVLTMASRNMTLQWFEQRRGFATGFSNVFISLGFSFSPALLYLLIQDYSWRGAWILLAVFSMTIFPLLAIIFFRDKPEDSGLVPDGDFVSTRKRKSSFDIVKHFSLSEVRNNFTFWVCSFLLAMQGLYITAFTFHIVSIFEMVGLSEEKAIGIFQPIAVIAVVVTLIASTLSDHISVKPLFIIKGLSACLAIVGVILLDRFEHALLLIIIGNGLMTGLFSVLMSVAWPRYFGRRHLGAISGQAISLIVFASALGPILFSQSLSLTGSYQLGGFICLAIYLVLTGATFFTKNPQLGAEASPTE